MHVRRVLQQARHIDGNTLHIIEIYHIEEAQGRARILPMTLFIQYIWLGGNSSQIRLRLGPWLELGLRRATSTIAGLAPAFSYNFGYDGTEHLASPRAQALD